MRPKKGAGFCLSFTHRNTGIAKRLREDELKETKTHAVLVYTTMQLHCGYTKQ